MTQRDLVDSHFTETVWELPKGHGAAAPADGAGPAQPSPGTVRDRDAPLRPGSSLTGQRCLELFDAQLASRHLDLAARWLRAEAAGFYTIGSAGHEGNAAVAAALRLTDPALLHYRSGAFYLVRAGQADPPRDGVRDVLLGLVAAADEPIAGGRHKVFGNHALGIIPQTSTIASHLPRAVGLAFAIGRAAKIGVPRPWPDDAVVVCSFGDASPTSMPTVWTWRKPTTPRLPRRAGRGSGGRPRSCTCRWFAFLGTQDPTSSKATAHLARSPPTWRSTR